MGLVKNIQRADAQLGKINITTKVVENGEEKTVLTKKARKLHQQINSCLKRLSVWQRNITVKNFPHPLFTE